MVVIYTDKLLHTVLRFGVPVCGHPTIVHGGLTSATFDEVRRRGSGEDDVSTVHRLHPSFHRFAAPLDSFQRAMNMSPSRLLPAVTVMQLVQAPVLLLLQTFGVLLYAAGRWNHLDLEHGVFTARLEVDYKKV